MIYCQNNHYNVYIFQLNIGVYSFTSIPFRLYLTHKPGMESQELLPDAKKVREELAKKEKEQKTQTQETEEQPKEEASLWSKLFGSKTDDTIQDDSIPEGYTIGEGLKLRKNAKPDNETTLNIMSIASGHLYERFLRIMMISVLRNTKAKHVKFWFFKQFLSPQFKRFIKHWTEHYKCSIELIEYRWPEWLNEQTEKQRIIWAYKILFLDVLFPLNLERIIFVDADQIVRTDLLELWNADLDGKPYGYTPFCDSNLDTEGFRFWKQGYWLNHLNGKPYHISALYVVDLNIFRSLRAGDSLRILYQQLSQDPNSLANLDQDLPNFAQHNVPIYSLPQEWLFCETWCHMDTLSDAKTIDLCNNPLTKEPKLDKAKRLIKEWESIDNEGTNFINNLIKKGII